jgi:Beta-propeller repeat
MRALIIVLLAACEAGAGQSVPVFYIANHGQAPPNVRFMTKGSGLTAYFLRREIILRAHDGSVHMRFEGASPSTRLEGAEPLQGRANFLTGAAQRWRRDEPTFGGIRYRGLYAGIDMIYGANGRQLKSEFVVAPGADPGRIRIRYTGSGAAAIEPDGALSVPLGGRRLGEGAPYIYQERNGVRVAVEGRYSLAHDGTVGFALGPYNTALPLIIDPILSFSTLLGGSGFDAATGIAVDAAGSAYIAGYTDSYNLPTANPEQNFNAGGNEVFVAKLNPAGSGIEYCTYIGGSADDRAYGIAVDASGSAYITGSTTSHNFPTRYPIQSMIQGGRSAFVLKLNPAGNMLVFSTYLGGNGSDTAYGIALDAAGNSYVVGDTTSMDFPAAAFQSGYHGSQDAFVAKISADGGRLLYGTYLGGAAIDHGAAIAVDAGGSAYITGSTYSLDFPVANAFQSSIGGWCDAFVARLSSDGNTLLFSTFLGGSGGWAGYPEAGQGVALDTQGNAFVVGVTSSLNFPLSHPLQPVLLGSTDAFVSKFNSSGALLYSTYMGGSGVEVGNAIAVDFSGAAYVVGYTYSTDFPVTAGIQANIGGDCDAFLIKLSPSGDALLYGTYLGGSSSDTASGVALDANGDVYIAGLTLSPDFPVLRPVTF